MTQGTNAELLARVAALEASLQREAAERRRLEQALAESLEQQTATSKILRVISSSPTDLQPVLDTMAESAARLCAAYDASIRRLDGDVLRLAAHYGTIPNPLGLVVPAIRGTVTGRTVLDRQTVHVEDLHAEAEEFPEGSTLARELGHRTILSVPLLREGVAIGVIVLRRTEVQPFTDKQIALLKTFADQAVIAIENVRLFTELQQKNQALTQAHAQVTEALEQQTATAEILRVISSSPTDLRPVFDAIADSGRRLCDGDFCNVARYEDGLIHLAAHAETTPDFVEVLQRMFPMPPTRASTFGRTILERAVVYIRDVREEPEYSQTLAEAHRARSAVGVPMLRDGRPIGAIVVGGREPRQFMDAQVALLQTFADQAVIAIENVRLFKELQASNRELTTALDQQTATGDILRVISQSPTDVGPVLDAVAESAARLCGATDAMIFRVEGGMIRRVAHVGTLPLAPESELRPMTRDTTTGRAILERRTIHVDDIVEEFARGNYLAARALQEPTGFRTILSVPLVHEAAAIGVIAIRRYEVRPFTAKQIELVQTFADQAVIAIENVRLFTELQARTGDLTRSVAELTALGDVGRAVSSTVDLLSLG